ncbi:hypothetical protein, conserved [Plasmodium gonderi]|uniref:RAP domain-containing protein n=1 Tax=Plasmodium gonderi TaxID=77519 RepID=A0A1Y1JNH7_PLAGO|nr:hypothetical protein, conserved [Plasmodium gonderi]GAW82372.1 hypothetical protein, conserved [Plasmodium gonderi]
MLKIILANKNKLGGCQRKSTILNKTKCAFGSLNHELKKFERLSSNMIQCINKYKKEKEICISSYKNYKKEIKECVYTLFSEKILKSLKKDDFKIIFAYTILLSKRVLIEKELLKNVILSYVLLLNENEKKEGKNKNLSKSIDGKIGQNDTSNSLLLVIKYLYYLNIDYDKIIYNYIYSELNNEIEFYTLEQLVESVKLVSSFKNKKWINQKFFSRSINEIVKRSNEGKTKDISKYLVTIIKSCSRLNCEITDIHILLEILRDNYNKGEKKDIHILIKVIYNIFLCNYYNYKNINQLINLLKLELICVNKEEEYPTYKKYQYNNNVILDTNIDMDLQMSKNSSNIAICNDNINSIHQLYFNAKENKLNDSTSITLMPSVSLYRLKFLDLLIRSDNFLYNNFYNPNAQFFDFVKQLKIEGKDSRETIFSKQVIFFIKENGYKVENKQIHIYPISYLPDFRNTYVELVHNRNMNKNVKDSQNKFHRHYLNYKLRHLKFLGWNPIMLYEYEWKKLRNYDEKFEYIKKAFKSVRSHTY